MAVEALFPLATFQSPGEFLPHTENWFLPLRWYGLLIATAVLIGLNLSSRLAKLRHLENGLISDLLPVLVLFAVIGARLYYCLLYTSPSPRDLSTSRMPSSA